MSPISNSTAHWFCDVRCWWAAVCRLKPDQKSFRKLRQFKGQKWKIVFGTEGHHVYVLIWFSTKMSRNNVVHQQRQMWSEQIRDVSKLLPVFLSDDSLKSSSAIVSVILKFVSWLVTYVIPQSGVLPCPCSSCRQSQHRDPQKFPVPPVVHIQRKAVCQDTCHPASGSILPLTPNNASRLLKSISMTKVMGDKPRSACLHDTEETIRPSAGTGKRHLVHSDGDVEEVRRMKGQKRNTSTQESASLPFVMPNVSWPLKNKSKRRLFSNLSSHILRFLGSVKLKTTC